MPGPAAPLTGCIHGEAWYLSNLSEHAFEMGINTPTSQGTFKLQLGIRGTSPCIDRKAPGRLGQGLLVELVHGHRRLAFIRKPSAFGEQEPSPTGSPVPKASLGTARSSLERGVPGEWPTGLAVAVGPAEGCQLIRSWRFQQIKGRKTQMTPVDSI